MRSRSEINIDKLEINASNESRVEIWPKRPGGSVVELLSLVCVITSGQVAFNHADDARRVACDDVKRRHVLLSTLRQ
jgi:hypothetical protein